MNDMSRSQSASRISEDIGDVLGAIRRLIADDEALDYSRNDQGRLSDAPVKAVDSHRDDAQALAARFGGAAALARRMVQDSAALTAAQKDNGGSSAPNARAWPHLVADRQIPAARPLVPGIVALRDQPARQGSHRPVADLAMESTPLRLGEADRVGALAQNDPDDAPDGTLQGGAQSASQCAVSAPSAITISDDLDDLDDFAEAFDAKARMRPDVFSVDIAPAVELHEAEETDMRAEGMETDLGMPQADAADPFLQAYTAHADDPDDPAPSVADEDTPSLAAPRDAADQTPPVRGFGLTIPVYTDAMELDGQVDDDPIDMRPDPAPEMIAEPVQEEVIAETGEAVDEASIREVIREIIQEELHGELGQRFSRNLRAVIRREVAASIDEHLERL